MADHCTTCGMALRDQGEFHPFVFCVLKRAGRDPWADTRWLAEQLNLGELPEHPPLVRELSQQRARQRADEAAHG